jgi:hypothetical protein
MIRSSTRPSQRICRYVRGSQLQSRSRVTTGLSLTGNNIELNDNLNNILCHFLESLNRLIVLQQYFNELPSRKNCYTRITCILGEWLGRLSAPWRTILFYHLKIDRGQDLTSSDIIYEKERARIPQPSSSPKLSSILFRVINSARSLKALP